MRMYVACLASYNNGVLHGEWFDLEDYVDAADLQAAINEQVLMTSQHPNVTVECPHCEVGRRGYGVAQGSDFTGFYACKHCDGYGNHPSAEEWAAHDWDGEGLSEFGEYPGLEEILEHVRLVSEHGDAWVAFKLHFGADVTEQNFEDAHRGEYDSFEDFVEEWCKEVHGWQGDEPFYSWIDWERAARDLEQDFTFTDGHVFYSNW
ncbi:antirestriction protein ArdA [Pseudomonas solani]|uniref:antirestriction protein ArdA n=1 Tax=Pseudomonas solani TaxID=2731552 RepID=UPI003F4AB9EC